MMACDPFIADEHYSSLARWFTEWDSENLPTVDSLPRFGVVVDGLAMGFLYRTDAKMGIIENLVANPRMPKGLRNEALDLVVRAILDEAKRLKLEAIFGFTAHQTVVNRAVKHGFIESKRSYRLLARGL